MRTQVERVAIQPGDRATRWPKSCDGSFEVSRNCESQWFRTKRGGGIDLLLQSQTILISICLFTFLFQKVCLV